jgi:hypothetical protein
MNSKLLTTKSHSSLLTNFSLKSTRKTVAEIVMPPEQPPTPNPPYPPQPTPPIPSPTPEPPVPPQPEPPIPDPMPPQI